MRRLPRSLTSKYLDLARERESLRVRLAEVDAGLSSVVYALRVLDPAWAPPKVLPRRQKRITQLPRGAVASGCLELLRRHGELSTPALGRHLAVQHRLRLQDKAAEADFASSVAMALRRYERQGVVEVVGKDARTGALRWRLRTDCNGRLTVAYSRA
jgi:hypothetical protein